MAKALSSSLWSIEKTNTMVEQEQSLLDTPNTKRYSVQSFSDSEDLEIKKDPYLSSDDDENAGVCNINNPVENEKNICHEKDISVEQRNAFNDNKSCFLCRCSSRTCSSCLVYFGIGLIIIGSIVPFGWWSIRIVAPLSYENVDPPVHVSYVSWSMMIVCGILAVITRFKRHNTPLKKHKLLIIVVLLLSIICTAFCICSLIYLIVVVHASLNQLENCKFSEYDRICSCYITQGTKKQIFKFAENIKCGVVKSHLKELVYGVSGLFGVGFLISVATALSAIYMLHKERKDKIKRTRQALRSINNCVTTQTQESSFMAMAPFRLQRQPIVPKVWKFKEERSSHGIGNNLSVATQTPSSMMPVAQMVYDVSADDSTSQSSIETIEYAPPSYNDAVKAKSKLSK